MVTRSSCEGRQSIRADWEMSDRCAGHWGRLVDRWGIDPFHSKHSDLSKREINNIKDGCIPFGWASSKTLVMDVHWLTSLTYIMGREELRAEGEKWLQPWQVTFFRTSHIIKAAKFLDFTAGIHVPASLIESRLATILSTSGHKQKTAGKQKFVTSAGNHFEMETLFDLI